MVSSNTRHFFKLFTQDDFDEIIYSLAKMKIVNQGGQNEFYLGEASNFFLIFTVLPFWNEQIILGSLMTPDTCLCLCLPGFDLPVARQIVVDAWHSEKWSQQIFILRVKLFARARVRPIYRSNRLIGRLIGSANQKNCNIKSVSDRPIIRPVSVDRFWV